MSELTPVVAALKTVVLVLGGAITLFAGKAYRRTGAFALRSLAVGFGLVTLGALGAGLADQVLHMGTDAALVIESSVTALGFLVITYSLYQR